MAENRHHNSTKAFRRGVMPKGKLIDTKSSEMGMLLERIKKMAEVQNLLMDRLNILNGFEGLAPVSLQEVSSCTNCSRLNHVEIDSPVMAVQGQGMYRQSPIGGPSQQGRPNYSDSSPNYYCSPIFNNNPSQPARFRRNNNQTYPPT